MLLEDVMNVLAGLLPGRSDDPKLAVLDRGVLTVALMVAALDGEIRSDEYAAFAAFARRCRGASDKNINALVAAAIPSVGRILAMAQLGPMPEQVRLEAFVSSATAALPRGFADGSIDDMRRAFALWVAMGFSDGSLSAFERRAIETLAERFSSDRYALDRIRAENVAMNVPMGRADLEATLRVSRVTLIDADFIDRAERIVRDLSASGDRKQAELALAELVVAIR